ENAMNRKTQVILHAVAGTVAMLCIAAFLSATVWVELTGGPEQITAVKRAIVYGLAVLIPSLAVTGLSGLRLAGRSRAAIVVAKKRRMGVNGLNGLLILLPAALTLDRFGAAGTFGTVSYLVQGAEVIAGPTILTLL